MTHEYFLSQKKKVKKLAIQPESLWVTGGVHTQLPPRPSASSRVTAVNGCGFACILVVLFLCPAGGSQQQERNVTGVRMSESARECV